MDINHNDPAFMSAWHDGTLNTDQLSELTTEQTEKYSVCDGGLEIFS